MHHRVILLDAQTENGQFDVSRSFLERDCIVDTLVKGSFEVSVAHNEPRQKD